MMPSSSQNLYFHLGMNADDDGFCEHFAIMRMTDSKPDDLRVLQAKGFVKVFDEKILIILDWKENNLIRSDRYTPSKYLDIYKREIKLISKGKVVDTVGIPDDNQMEPQVRLGKVSIDNIYSESSDKSSDSSIKRKNSNNDSNAPSRKPAPHHAEAIELITLYTDLFTKHKSSTKPMFNMGAAIKLARQRIGILGLDRMKELLYAYLGSDEQFYRDNVWSITCFLSEKVVNKLNLLTQHGK